MPSVFIIRVTPPEPVRVTAISTEVLVSADVDPGVRVTEISVEVLISTP